MLTELQISKQSTKSSSIESDNNGHNHNDLDNRVSPYLLKDMKILEEKYSSVIAENNKLLKLIQTQNEKEVLYNQLQISRTALGAENTDLKSRLESAQNEVNLTRQHVLK